MIKIDLQRIKNFSTREVIRQIADALNYLDQKESSGSTRTIITSGSGARENSYNVVEYIVDATIKTRGWVIIDHTPITNSEIVFFNGIAILKGNDDRGVPAEYGIVGNIISFVDDLEMGDVIKINYAHY